MRALRGAAALLRGAAALALAPQRATPVAACAQAAELARRLDQGCAARHAATAAGDEPGRLGRDGGRQPAGGEAAQAEPLAQMQRARHSGAREAAGGEAPQAVPPARKRKAPNVGTYGEKTADGKPKPDERTVAYLLALGWWETEEEVVAVLTSAENRVQRYAFETAKPAADWLEARLGREPMKEGALRPGAKAVKAFPDLLWRDAATLQRKWDALTLSPEQGGVGIGFSAEQAREAVLKFAQVLGLGVDTLASGWSMLTATKGGLGLSPEEARKGILRGPNILRYDYDYVIRRVGLLKDLGYADARGMVLIAPPVLNFEDKTVMEHAAWWRQTQLDHVKIITSKPNLLGGVSTTDLERRLRFLGDVAKLSVDDLNHGAPYLTCSLDKMLRPRFFYALKHGALERYKLSSLTFCSVANYLRMVHRLDAPAGEAEVDSYKAEVASADFQVWAAQEEARCSRHTPEQTT